MSILSTRKILNILNESTVLNEDLGTLEFIDPQFRKAFMNYHGKKLAKGLTSDSPVKKERATVASGVRKLFDDKNVFGIVLGTDDKQYAAIIVNRSDRFNKGDSYNLIMDRTFLREIGVDTYGLNGGSSKTAVVKDLKEIIDAVSDSGKSSFAYVVEVDNTKGKLRSDRAEARRGSIFFAKDAVRELRQNLNSRLAAFKASRGDQVEDFDAAVELLKEKLADNLIVNGVKYRLERSNLYLDSLRSTKDDSWHESYVEYRMFNENSRWDAQRDWRKANPNATDEEYAEFVKSLPPRSFTVTLKLDGMTLVPNKLKFSDY